MKGQSGMTLVELMVSLAITLLVVAASTAAYLKILTTYKTQGAMSESFMSNLTGFEVLRYDLEMAGYGLPRGMGTGFTYTEALASGSYGSATYTPPYDPSTLNEANLSTPNPNGVPHAFALNTTAGKTTLSGNTSEVLGLKSTVANINTASSHFGIVTANGVENGVTLVNGDHYMAMSSAGTLVQGSSASTWDNAYPTVPASGGEVLYLYGLSTSVTQRMPFNRVDYYLDSTSLPGYCAQGTYELYRSVVSQTDGTLTASPLIDCVEDFQVAFGIDPSGNGTQAIIWQNNLYQNNIPSGAHNVLMTPAQMQQYLQEVKVFVIYQEGRGKVSRTSDFTFSGSLPLGDTATGVQNVTNGGLNLNPLGGNQFTPTGVNAPYRWRVEEIDVKPMNMVTNW